MAVSLARNALLLGNVVTGLSVLAPAAMLPELAAGLDVSIQAAGWLVTFGAIVMCFGSPLMAWATTHIDRRTLMTVTLGIVAFGHIVSAFAPNYAVLLAARLVLLAVAALYTPQAASTVALIVSEKDRPGAIAYVFIGWSLAIAVGLPLLTFLAVQFGWRAAYGGIAVLATVAMLLNAVGLPSGLRGAPLSLASWVEVARNRQIVLLLLITIIVISGTFQTFVFIGPLFSGLTGAGPQVVAVTLAVAGFVGLLGNVATTRAVAGVGPYGMSLLLIATMFVGLLIWAFGAGALAAMIAGMAIASVGFAASNSIQQARLAIAAPALASASIALNTSAIYVGQAIGSAIGAELIARNMLTAVGFVAAAITGCALLVVLMTRDESRVTPP
ncbi:MAG TPA: MFS transporter [Xanthobacteraceae bacterium]|nr:MFS transporter [Xanthobacteraceae bacterium]